MNIKTERLTIRHIIADDWKSIRDIWTDFNTSTFRSTIRHTTQMMRMFSRELQSGRKQTAARSICFSLFALTTP